MKLLVLAIAATLTVGLVPTAQSAVQPRTTAPPEVVTVKITISDSRIGVHPKVAPRGAIGRFVLINIGKKPHTFALGHEKRGTGSQTGFTRSLKPNQQQILILFFDYRGVLPYSGTLPADRKSRA